MRSKLAPLTCVKVGFGILGHLFEMERNLAQVDGRRLAPVVAIVEDDEGVRDSVRLLLEASGLRCEDFASAEAFLAGGGAGRASCLVVDVDLPGIGGIDLLARLAAAGIEPAALLLSGRIDEIPGQKSRAAGRYFLPNPFDPELLIGLVAAALAQAAGRLPIISSIP